jgi:hypothetical protein
MQVHGSRSSFGQHYDCGRDQGGSGPGRCIADRRRHRRLLPGLADGRGGGVGRQASGQRRDRRRHRAAGQPVAQPHARPGQPGLDSPYRAAEALSRLPVGQAVGSAALRARRTPPRPPRPARSAADRAGNGRSVPSPSRPGTGRRCASSRSQRIRSPRPNLQVCAPAGLVGRVATDLGRPWWVAIGKWRVARDDQFSGTRTLHPPIARRIVFALANDRPYFFSDRCVASKPILPCPAEKFDDRRREAYGGSDSNGYY